MLRRSLIRGVLPLMAGKLRAQLYVPGPQVTTFFSDVDDSDQPYALYLPRNLDGAARHPLVISLHGEDSNHQLNLRRVFGRGNLPGQGEAEAPRVFPHMPEVDCIVACPLARGTMGYYGIAEKDVYDVVADVQRRFPVDEDRIYLTGLSMGGGGALRLGLTRPGIWAAIAPVCPEPPAATGELAPNALNLPVRLFHGDKDPAVSVEVSRKWQKTLLRLGVNVEYIEYPNVRHNSWDLAYKNGAIFDWFSKYRRSRFPARVRFVTRAYKYNSAHWVHIDGLTPGELASIDARFTGDNRIEIATAALDGFTLNLAGHPRFRPASALSISVDGREHRLRTNGAVSFSKAAAKWSVERYRPSAREKRPWLEGPISEAVASRHAYVYGTLDNPSADELERRRQAALRAAEWSTPRRRLLLSLQAVADRDLKEANRKGNLVLFGTAATNRIVAGLRLPLGLNRGAADYGLVFTYPANGRYVVVNSGLAWWTGAEQSRRPGLRYTGAPASVLPTFADYILFKGSLDNVVAEGRFDRNWSLPPADAAKIKMTGAVSIQQ